MAKDSTYPGDLGGTTPVKAVSATFMPRKIGKQKHLACAETVDPSYVIDRVAYEVSEDGGATWREIAFATNAVAARSPSDPTGPMQMPGLVVNVDMDQPGAIFRTVISHRSGKSVASLAKEMA